MRATLIIIGTLFTCWIAYEAAIMLTLAHSIQGY
jgi:hypothetical protein